ncbi:MAG: sigma-70 family RNA polymerase sigma factor [Lyngbya sp. HA4199-MV5]|nr:sigma-70 family RNA polymerase sigma factor [Lyngbya sp. HA4199-MV5]
MNERDYQLNQLVCKACACAASSPERQRCLDQLIRQLTESGRLWSRSDIPDADFQDILQKSWIYLCRNLCEATTAAVPYDPTRSSVLTWINAYIKMRVLDYRLENERMKQQQVTARVMEDGNVIHPIDLLPAPNAASPIVQEILAWVERDSVMLCRVHVRDRPDVHCKALILRRLPPDETPWQELAQEFKLSENTLRGFYRQKCLPPLKEAGRQLGYL